MLKAYILSVIVIAAVHLGASNSSVVWKELYRLSVPSRDDSLRFEATRKMERMENSKIRVVLIGSSQTREDFDVGFLNRHFRGQIEFINLGVSGTGNPIYMYMLTPRILELKPDMVIYMPFIGSLFRPYAYRTFEAYFDPNILPLIYTEYGWSELLEQSDRILIGYLGLSSDLFRYRSSIQHIADDIIMRWIQNSPPKTAQRFQYKSRKSERHFRALIQRHKHNPRYREHRYLPLTELAFHSMLRAFNDKNLPVLVIDGPTNPRIGQTYDQSLDALYKDFMDTTAASYGFLHLGSEDLPDFRDEDFNDFTHLNASSRLRFSSFIANYIEKNTKLQ